MRRAFTSGRLRRERRQLTPDEPLGGPKKHRLKDTSNNKCYRSGCLGLIV